MPSAGIGYSSAHTETDRDRQRHTENSRRGRMIRTLRANLQLQWANYRGSGSGFVRTRELSEEHKERKAHRPSAISFRCRPEAERSETSLLFALFISLYLGQMNKTRASNWKTVSWAIFFWFDRGITASKVLVLLPCVHGTAVSHLRAAFKSRVSPGERCALGISSK